MLLNLPTVANIFVNCVFELRLKVWLQSGYLRDSSNIDSVREKAISIGRLLIGIQRQLRMNH